MLREVQARTLVRMLSVIVILAGIATWVAGRVLSRNEGGDASAPALAGADFSPRSDPAPAPSESTGAVATGGTSASATESLAEGAAAGPARVVHTEPSGVHVALDAKLVVKLDRAVDPESIKLTIDPPTHGTRTSPDPQTLVLTPARWHEGKRIHVRVEGPSIETADFDFTSLAPPPERIEPGNGSRVTLTFDDGATSFAHVTRLLDFLKEERISAIFFPIGFWAETHPKLVGRMRADGHRVCNHTYSHPRLPTLSDELVKREIEKGAGGGTCPLFRPPMRAYDERIERIVAELGYTMYLWDVDSRDWEGLPAEDMANRVLKRVRPGSVVLFHIHSEETLKALPLIVPKLRKAGYVLRDPEDAGAPDAAIAP